jgi:hypothetical protein
VIIWRFLENMSYDEVGRIVRKSNGAIRVIQFRALKQLRGILEAMEESDPANTLDFIPSHGGSSQKKASGSANPLAEPLPLA